MIDTLKIFTPEFSLQKNNKFVCASVTDSSGFQVKEKKHYCNDIDCMNFDIKQGLDGQPYLYLKTSLPKLIYGSSYYEVTEDNLSQVIEELESGCEQAGIHIPKNGLSDFEVSRIDFCKNVEVDHNLINYMLAFKNYTIPQKTKQEFKQETLTYYNKSHEYTFYNKIKEIKDNDKNANSYKFLKDHPENILRIESRLKKASVIKNQVKGIIKNDIANLFDKSIARDNLLKHYKYFTTAQDVQLQLDFDDFVNNGIKLREQGKRNIALYLSSQMGLDYILQSHDNDWNFVRKSFLQMGFTDRQTYNQINTLKEVYNMSFNKLENTILIKEVESKLKIA